MSIKTRCVNLFFASRIRKIKFFKKHPIEVQNRQFAYLMRECEKTAIGKEFGITKNTTYQEFVKRMPIMQYKDFIPYVKRIHSGEKKVTWSKPVKWFAKSSGTTESKSKYIPVTKEGLKDSHMRGPKDILAMYIYLYPRTKILGGKMLTLGGSNKLEKEGDKIYSGDLSSILIERTPGFATWFRIPRKKAALLADFDKKVQYICENATNKDVRAFAGVPSWNLVMLNRVLEYTGKKNIAEVWPNMELFTHGGMNFKPYKEQYHKIIPLEQMNYLETYNASEGFFAMSDELNTDEMLLMLDYGTFYEFIPTSTLDDSSTIVPLEEVELGVNYAIIISSSNGLWRYKIGDTVMFTSITPYKIRFTGRTKLFVNAFGEEIIIENAEHAMEIACRATQAEVSEYTMAPIYMSGKDKGAHEWVIEFRKNPNDIKLFTQELDKALQSVNSDYEAKRLRNTTLYSPTITVVEVGTFMEFLRSEGRLGGQIKIPRLNNDRTYIDRLLNHKL